MLRASILTAALLTACSGDSPQSPDVRFDVRDAVIDPRDQGAGDVAQDVSDAVSPVDVTVFDVVAFDVPAQDAPTSDVARPDASLDLPLLTDTPTTPCSELAEQYAAAVRIASTCAAAVECGARVCETLCCVCEVFVAAPPEQLRALDALRASADRLGCSGMLPCPTTRCLPPRSGQCSSDGRCVTIRDPADASIDVASDAAPDAAVDAYPDLSADVTADR
ncbi:MAG: hypothetical protein U0326_17785 [Polyangiales bacterium]